MEFIWVLLGSKYTHTYIMVFLVFEENELEVHGYLNINSQSDIDHSKSQSAYVFTMNRDTFYYE